MAELVVDVRLPDFSGQQTGCEPNFDLRPPGVRGFRGAGHRTHFCGGRFVSATQWVAFFGSRGKIRPATHFRGGGIPSATHRRSKKAIRAATHPARPENWSRDPPRRRKDDGGGSRLESGGSHVEHPNFIMHVCIWLWNTIKIEGGNVTGWGGMKMIMGRG